MTQLAEPTQTTKSRYVATRAPLLTRVKAGLTTPGGLIWVLLIALIIAIFLYNPQLGEPGQFLRFLARMAPIAIVAIGQYFVLVSGEFDLSMGAVIGVQVVLAGTLISEDPARIVPTVLLMFGIAVLVGLINGLVTTLLRVPGFITSLGMMLLLSGLAFYSTGGSAGQNPVDEFRVVGRGGFEAPLIGYIPWAVVVLAAVIPLAVWLTRRPFGRLLLLSGANAEVARLTGTRVWWLQTRAYIISACAATVAAILLVGFAGVHPSVGNGYEFTAITACVLGGVVLGGGRGWLLSVVAGAFVLESLFTLLNFVGIEATWRPTVQGAIIIIAMIAAGPKFFHWKRPAKRGGPSTDLAPKTPDSGDETSSLPSAN